MTETPAASVPTKEARNERVRDRADWAKTIAGGDDGMSNPKAQAALHQQAQFWTDLEALVGAMGSRARARKICTDIADECSDAVDVCEETMHEPLQD